MRLYDNPVSGNCYKIRLFLALIGKEYESIPVDSLHGETREPHFLAISPRGLIPVLEDNNVRISDSIAILVYLARRYAPEWLPDSPVDMARVMEWLAIAADELQHGAAQARRIVKLGASGNLSQAQTHAKSGLTLIEKRLESNEWLCDTGPTIADIACYPYIALIPEGGVSLDHYPAICEWIARIHQMTDYVPMEGL